MQVTTKAIVLTSLKYGDSSLIVKAFTASDGLKAYMLKGVLKSKRGKLKAAYFQPLMQLELVATHRNKGTLESIKEVRIGYPYKTLHDQMVKRAMVLFLAEILSNCIHEEERNEDLYHYLEAALQWLDSHDAISNFHLLFLLELTKYLGFYPDTTNGTNPYFDLCEGAFVSSPSLNPVLSGQQLDYFRLLLGMHFDAVHTMGLGKKDRHDLLQSLLLYFEVHLHGFRKPRSLAVLNEVFN